MREVPVSGVRRLFISFLLSGLASAATAQSNVVAPPPPPRADTVGPEQLRDFALPGTRQQPQPAETPPAATTPTRPASAATTTLPPATRERTPPATAPRTTATPAQSAPPATRPAETVSLALPGTQAPAATPPATAGTTPSSPFDLPAPTAVPEGSLGLPVPAPTVPTPITSDEADSGWLLTLLPFLLVALAGAAFAWWWPRRRRAEAEETSYGQLAFAGAPTGATNTTTAPAPRPAPAPVPQPEAPARAPSVGLVSSRLRAWLELDLAIRIAAITDEELLLEVDILLTNSGSAPAREIAVEALLINAGPEQGKEIATFYARPDATDFARDSVAPMGQMALSATLKLPRAAFLEYAVGGGKVVVPIVALNAGYKAGSSRGRTSAAFLAGRAGVDAEKLGPFPTDQGAKGFNRLGLKRLPEQVRR
jgi:hypothetical protein